MVHSFTALWLPFPTACPPNLLGSLTFIQSLWTFVTIRLTYLPSLISDCRMVLGTFSGPTSVPVADSYCVPGSDSHIAYDLFRYRYGVRLRPHRSVYDDALDDTVCVRSPLAADTVNDDCLDDTEPFILRLINIPSVDLFPKFLSIVSFCSVGWSVAFWMSPRGGQALVLSFLSIFFLLKHGGAEAQRGIGLDLG
jgi:hypothetical protein